MFFPRTINAKLRRGEVAFGTLAQAPCCAGIEILGLAGFDFVVFDGEHGPLTIEMIEMLTRSCHGAGLAPIVRMPKAAAADILRALDCGAGGVQVPHINSRKDAEEVVEMTRYFPLGDRGLNPYVRAASFGDHAVKEYMEQSNREVTVAISLEGGRAAEKADEILSVEGLDVVFLGPYDLSQSLGVPGQIAHPSVTDLMEKLVGKIRSARKHAGVFVDNPDDAARWMKLGVQYIVHSVDTRMYLKAAQKIVADLHAKDKGENSV